MARTGEPTLVTGGDARADGPVWVAGLAQRSKLGPIVDADGVIVTCAGLAEWPDDVVGRPVVVAGTLARRSHPPLPVGPNGERSAGAEGDETILTGCAVPPERDDGLRAVEQAIMDALAHRDGAALAAIVAPEFVLRMPGEPETRRDAFLAEAAAIPGEIVSVTGEAITTYRTGDTGIVRGRQIAKVKIEGTVHEVRGTFVDVFARRDGRWMLVLALNVNDS